MVAKHSNELVNRLLKALAERNSTIPKFSEETKIPKDRVYKWIQEGTNPKHEDAKIIEAWLTGETSNSYKEKYHRLLEEHNETLKSNLRSLTKRIEVVESILGVSPPAKDDQADDEKGNNKKGGRSPRRR